MQPTTVNGLMQGAGQHPQFGADGWHSAPLVQQSLGLRQSLRVEFAPLAFGRRVVKRLRPPFSKLLNAALDGRQREAKGFGDLPLAGRPIDDQLSGEHPKRGQVILLMSQDG